MPRKHKKRDGYASDGGSATGRYIHNSDRSEISEISHDSAGSSSRFTKFTHPFRKKSHDDNASTASKGSLFNRFISPKKKQTPSSPKSPKHHTTDAHSDNATATSSTDTKKLLKDSKARYNIGLVYLKTGDYTKAQENLEHSLYCHVQLHGHDVKAYSNQVLVQVAAVREKLGDCYVQNPAGDKALAMDYYQEVRRMLRGLDSEDAPEEALEMMERIEGKVKDPQLKRSASTAHEERVVPLPPAPRSFDKKKREKSRGTRSVGGSSGGRSREGKSSGGGRSVGSSGKKKKVQVVAAAGVGATVAGGAAAGKKQSSDGNGSESSDSSFNPLQIVRKGRKKLTAFSRDIIDGIGDVFDDGHDLIHGAKNNLTKSLQCGTIDEDCVENFEVAIQHLERNNHRTALNHLSQLKSSEGMHDSAFRHLMVDYMLRVAVSAMQDEKIGVGTDAYEETFALLRQEDDPGRNLGIVSRGCIKGHKLLAAEEEKDEDWDSAIEHRNRVFQLLDMENKIVPCCNQLIMVAYCYGQLGNYTQSVDTLSDAMKRLTKGVKSMDLMPKNRIPPLIRACQMRAACYSKLEKWKEAHDQYDEVLPLIAREEGIFTKSYNHALIQKGALLVTLGKYRESVAVLEKYIKVNEDHENPKLQTVIDDDDHLLALDTFAAAHLKLGKVDRAINIFQLKLEKLSTMPKSDEAKGQTMHNLGCLMAYKKNYADALPMLSKALDTRKFMYNGTNKFLFESTWGVAATSHALGDSSKAMKEYGKLLEKMNKVEGSPIDAITIHNSAGKLYFDANKLDLSLKSYSDALKKVDQTSPDNHKLKATLLLSLANVQTARGDSDKAVRSYDEVVNMKRMKGSYEYFSALYNKSLLLEKMGDVEESRSILKDITGRRSKAPDEIKGSAFITLGNIVMASGSPQDNLEDALKLYHKAVDLSDKDESSPTAIQAKRRIGIAYYEAGEYDDAIEELQSILEELSASEGKNDIAKAETWSSLSRVYQRKGDVAQAKNYAKLSLQAYKSGLGEKHPTSLRQSSNLAVILLEEAEALPKGKESQAKTIIDAAKYEMEEALESFVSLDDLWTYRLDVAALKTNLGLIAVWQNKPKKAKKLLRQVKEIEILKGHPLVLRIENLESKVQSIAK